MPLKTPHSTLTSDYAIAFETELKWFALLCSETHVKQLGFALPTFEAACEKLPAGSKVHKITKQSQLEKFPDWISDLVHELQLYANGEDVAFDQVPVEIDGLTKFQQRVVHFCRKIPHGQVKTYGELARLAGSTGAARAVGSVMATNRIPILIPCHRVVGSNGLGGFSAPGGLATKRKLLELEASLTAVNSGSRTYSELKLS